MRSNTNVKALYSSLNAGLFLGIQNENNQTALRRVFSFNTKTTFTLMHTTPEHQNVTFIETGDGSHSLVWPNMDEAYHSRHGAVRESRHVFIAEGIEKWLRDNPNPAVIRIFEVGFGTGLNALLSLEFTLRNPDLSIFYHSLEAYPIQPNMAHLLNYPHFVDEAARPYFPLLHQADWGEALPITEGFTLYKEQVRLEDWHPRSNHADVVFFDAFAPNKQAEMWDFTLIEKSVQTLRIGGVWVSYCATGQLRRDLKACALLVEKPAGPPGKREMTRGTREKPLR